LVDGQRLLILNRLPNHPRTDWVEASLARHDRTLIPWKSSLAKLSRSLIHAQLNEFELQALLCWDHNAGPTQVINDSSRAGNWMSVLRRFARLGDETQRQLSDLAIGRATILLFGLFCRVIMTTYLLRTDQFMSALCAVRYLKPLYTFSDSNDLVREHLWSASETLCMPPVQPDTL